MELWIPITLAAAFFQNLRSALQKHLKGRLSTPGATFSRFAYAAPLALVYVAALGALTGEPLPRPNVTFALYALVGGLAQITATALHAALASCAPGLLTVNIDNGYGAASAALRVLGVQAQPPGVEPALALPGTRD